MDRSRRIFIRAGAGALPALVCIALAERAEAAVLSSAAPALVDGDGTGAPGKGRGTCLCARCASGNPPPGHLA